MTEKSPQGHRYRPRAALVWACAAGIWALALTPQARAEYKLGVLQLESEDMHDDAFAPAFMQQLRAALGERKDYTLVDTHVSLTQLSVAQDCNTADAECLTRIAHSLDLDGFVFGKWTYEAGTPVVMVRRYDTHSTGIQASALASFSSRDVDEAKLRAEAERLVRALLGPVPAPTPSISKADLQHELLPPAATAPASEQSASGGIDARSFAGYALIAAAAASAGMAVYSFVQVDDASHDSNFEHYRAAVGQNNPSAHDVCDEADAGKRYGLAASDFKGVKSACSRGTTFEVLQFVFLGAAVASAGAATFLLLGGHDDEHAATTKVRVQPTAARSGVGLNAQLMF